MNRIQQQLTHVYGSAAALRDGAETTTIEEGKFRSAGSGAGYGLFAPLHYEANYAYPLIVWLHGPRDDERQLKRIMPFVSMRNYVAVGLRGTVDLGDGPATNGYCWSQSEDHILLAEHRVLEAVGDACEQFNIASSRIFLAGFGCGGTMAFRLALNLPEVFAGALSLLGPFPTGHRPLARLHEARRQRFLLATGRDCDRFSPPQVCANLRLLYAAGMSISLRQYPCGDDLTTHMLGDVDRWIMEQVAACVPANEDAV